MVTVKARIGRSRGVGPLTTVWATISHRRAQAVSLLLLSALVAASAVLGPLYARSLQHGLARDALDRASIQQIGVVVSQSTPYGGRQVPTPAAVEKAIPPALAAVLAPPTAMVSGQVMLTMSGKHGRQGVVTTAYAPLAGCSRLVLTAGRCPTAAGELLVSSAEAAFEGWKVGDRVGFDAAAGGQTLPRKRPATARVVGTYDPVADEAYWWNVKLTGRAGTVVSHGLSAAPQVDTPIVAPAFFDAHPEGTTLTVTHALRRADVGVDALPGLVAAIEQATQSVGDGASPTTLTTGLDQIGQTVVLGQQQASLLVPLLLGQLALLAVVVLGLACAAAVEQRRPEIALARLRGEGVTGARRLVVAELGTLVAVGVPLGFGIAVLVDLLAARLWLPAGVPLDVPVWAYAAALAALAGGLSAVVLATRSALREPIPSLLRSVPPRQRLLTVGMLDAVVITVAAAGVVTIVSGNVSGPLAMATPVLLALAVGLLLALVIVPLAAGVGRAALRRGRITTGLTGVQLARRPAVRRLVAIVTVATALLVFATDAFLVAERNREQRAWLETGAQVVLRTDSKDPVALRQLLRTVDPASAFTAPVAQLSASNSSALGTMAVVPEAMGRIVNAVTGDRAADGAGGAAAGPGVDRAVAGVAAAGAGTRADTGAGTGTDTGTDAGATTAKAGDPRAADAIDWSRLSTQAGVSTEIVGRTISVTVSDVVIDRVAPGELPTDTDASGSGGPTTQPPDELLLRAELASADGEARVVVIGAIPFRPRGPIQLKATVPCDPTACTLTGLSLDRTPDETRLIHGHVRLAGIRGSTSAPLALGGLTWMGSGTAYGPDQLTPDRPGFGELTPDKGHPESAVLSFGSTGGIVSVTASPPPVPAIVVPATQGKTPTATSALGFLGGTVNVTELGRARVAPGGRTNVTLVSYDALAERTQHLYATGELEVWVSDPSRLAAVTQALDDAGIAVRGTTARAEVVATFDRSASAWSLRLAVVIGVLALVLSALVLLLLTVTSWRTRSKDLATLRLAGVPEKRIRRVVVAEQVVVIGSAVVVGAVCGYVGAQLSLGLVPFFTTPSDVFVRDLDPATGPMAAVAGLTFVWLGAVGTLLGIWLARRAVVSRVRDQS